MFDSFRKQWIPWALATGRGMLGFVLIAGQRCNWNSFALAGIIVLALVSDIYDGVLARRWGCDTAGVRLFDSMADTLFYLCVGIALWIGQPRIWHVYGGLLAGLLLAEATRFAFDFWKYGKPGSYHSYLAKSLGLVLAVGVTATFAMGRPNVLIPIALCMAIASNLENLVMSIMLPVWTRDVKSLRAAWAIRKRELDRNMSGVEARGFSPTMMAGRKTASAVGLLSMRSKHQG